MRLARGCTGEHVGGRAARLDAYNSPHRKGVPGHVAGESCQPDPRDRRSVDTTQCLQGLNVAMFAGVNFIKDLDWQRVRLRHVSNQPRHVPGDPRLRRDAGYRGHFPSLKICGRVSVIDDARLERPGRSRRRSQKRSGASIGDQAGCLVAAADQRDSGAVLFSSK